MSKSRAELIQVFSEILNDNKEGVGIAITVFDSEGSETLLGLDSLLGHSLMDIALVRLVGSWAHVAHNMEDTTVDYTPLRDGQSSH